MPRARYGRCAVAVAPGLVTVRLTRAFCLCLRALRVGKQIVNVPSFMVRVDSQKHIDFALNSPFGGGRPGRCKRKNVKARGAPSKAHVGFFHIA